MGLEIKNITTFNDRGAIRTRIEAKLLSKKEVSDRKIQVTSQELTKTIGIPVSLQLSGTETTTTLDKASTIVKDANTAFKDINKVIPTIKNGQELFKKLEATGLKIVLRDGAVRGSDGKPLPDLQGGFIRSKNEIQVDLRGVGGATLPHELGHAIDLVLLQAKSIQDPAFSQIFSQEKQNFVRTFGFDVDHLYSDMDIQYRPTEYWAEAFARFMVDNKKLEQATPQTYQYIKNRLSELLR
ncbi:hypothetical protein ER45_028795 (plasmid) [Bacillus mycoides]|nr:hypothetical protein ER45_028795 [Bacillus mycoides]